MPASSYSATETMADVLWSVWTCGSDRRRGMLGFGRVAVAGHSLLVLVHPTFSFHPSLPGGHDPSRLLRERLSSSMPKTRNIRKAAAGAPRVKAATEGTQASSSKPAPKGRASPVKRGPSPVPFPTPPRTTHKRKRAWSRVTDSDSEEDEPGLELPIPDGDDHPSASKYDAQGALILGNKKRKTLDAIAEELSEAQEEAFWMGTSVPAAKGAGSSRSPAATRGRERSRSRTRSPSSSPPPAPHLLRRQHTGLASPPPSRRQPRTYVIRNVRAKRSCTTPPPAPAPASPLIRTRKPGLFPTRDSPDNPFLADATPDTAGPSGSGRAHTPESFIEKPTMTWVLCVVVSYMFSLLT